MKKTEAGGVAVALPNTSKIEKKSSALVKEAKGMKIKSAPSYQRAGHFLVSVKTLMREIDATFDPIIKAQRDALTVTRAGKAKHADPVKEAERIIKSGMGEWVDQEDAKRHARETEALRKAEEKAKAKQEAEEAEVRKAAEKARAEGDRRAAAALERDAKTIASTAPVVEPIEVMDRRPKIKGVGAKKNWSGEVLDFATLVKFVAKHPQWLELLKIDQSALNRVAKAQRELLNIPGVRVVGQTVIAAGARALGAESA